jgi:TPR repeat protein
MNPVARPWNVVVLLGLMALIPLQGLAGITPEEVKMFEGYKVKAEQGNAIAQLNLGNCYVNGDGVAKDSVQAFSWFRKSAEQGDARAQFNLGLCYVNGDGVAKDEIEAYAYWNLAGVTLEIARKNLAILEKRISTDARLLGQQRTKQLEKEISGRLETLHELQRDTEKEKKMKGA